MLCPFRPAEASGPPTLLRPLCDPGSAHILDLTRLDPTTNHPGPISQIVQRDSELRVGQLDAPVATATEGADCSEQHQRRKLSGQTGKRVALQENAEPRPVPVTKLWMTCLWFLACWLAGKSPHGGIGRQGASLASPVANAYALLGYAPEVLYLHCQKPSRGCLPTQTEPVERWSLYREVTWSLTAPGCRVRSRATIQRLAPST